MTENEVDVKILVALPSIHLAIVVSGKTVSGDIIVQYIVQCSVQYSVQCCM